MFSLFTRRNTSVSEIGESHNKLGKRKETSIAFAKKIGRFGSSVEYLSKAVGKYIERLVKFRDKEGHMKVKGII